MLNESLSKRTNKSPKINKVDIIENTKKTRKIINEEKAYVSPQQTRMLELMNYSPKS